MSTRKAYVTKDAYKAYLILQRRAFLQAAIADKDLLESVKQLKKVIDDKSDTKDALLECVTIIENNAEQRQIALFQIIRYIENMFGLQRKGWEDKATREAKREQRRKKRRLAKTRKSKAVNKQGG